MANRFSPGCLCCDRCPVMSDDFESGSVDSAKWTEEQGTWAVSCPTTCQLQGTGTHPVIFTKSKVDGYHAVKADITTANKARILIHVDPDDAADEYVAAEFDTAFGGTAKIITRTGGVDTEQATLSAPVTITQEWTFCSNATCYSLASADGTEFLRYNHGGSVPSGSRAAGLATSPSSTSSAYESFEFYEPDTPEGSEDCPECSCGCDGCFKFGTDVAETLTADLTNAFNPLGPGCSNVTIEASYGLTKVDDCEWEYSVAPADDIVYKITVDTSTQPPTITILYREGSTPASSTGNHNASQINDCSTGNFVGAFAGNSNCFIGTNSIDVTG